MKGASLGKQGGKRVPLGSMVFAFSISEADFRDYLIERLGEEKEQSVKTYMKMFRKLMMFAEKNRVSLEDIVADPESFISAYIEAVGLPVDRARVPRSIFLKHILPFLKDIKERLGERKTATGTKAPAGVKVEEEHKRDVTENVAEVGMVESYGEKEEGKVIHTVSGQGKQEIVVALLSMIGTVAGDIKTLSFPSLMLLKEGDYVTYFVALEKIDEDPLTLKLRGFYLEDWVEKIIAERKRRKPAHAYEGGREKELVEPDVEVVGIFKKDIIKFVELETHEHSLLLKKLQPLMEKIKDRLYEEFRYGRGGVRF